jgi:hypothetical protein
VKIETISAGLDIVQPREVVLYSRTFEQRQRSAVYGREARELVASARVDFAS